MAYIAIAVIVGAKYLLPALLVRFPFAAGWANFVLDTVDGDILIPLGLSDPVYQTIDKSADWVTYVFMVVAAWRWPLRKVIVALFIFRSIGQGLFFITRNELMFFFFPNFLEPLFLAYATILHFKKGEGHAFFKRNLAWILPIIVLYKLQDEWITHVGNIDRSELIGRLLPPW